MYTLQNGLLSADSLQETKGNNQFTDDKGNFAAAFGEGFKEMKLPSFQFYPGDWMKDPALRSVTYAARGLWLDMLCLMFESDRRGYLQHVTGKPVSLEQLARMTGGSTDQVSQLLQELEDSGVFSRTEHGMIYSRRMVRDEEEREKNAERQKRYKQAKNGQGNARGNGDITVPQRNGNVPSSSSSSSSPSLKTTAKTEEKTKDSASKKAEAVPDPRVSTLQRAFYEALKEKLGEAPAKYNGAAAGVGFKTLLQNYSLEVILSRFKAWFDSTQPFIVDQSYRVEMFVTHFNRLKEGPIVQRSILNDQRAKPAGYAVARPGKYQD